MKNNKNISKRFIIFDGCSSPFCVIWTKKYSKKEIREIAECIFFIKRKVFTNKYISKKLLCHICSSEYAKYFNILGISSWEISDEAIQKEYNFELFNRKNSPEKFFEKYDIV